MEFEKTRHDFGTIKEDNGVVNYQFKFTNKGLVPLVISSVKASCGCTTPEFSTVPVGPGQSGYIKAAFNPQNRPGVFDKTLTVSANTNPSTTQLRIHGIVVPKSRPVGGRQEFTDTIGNLRLQSRYLNFGNITTKEAVQKEFKILNEGDVPMEFSNPVRVPAHLKVVVDPATLDPKKVGVIKVNFFPRLKNDFGNTSDIFTIPTNDEKFGKKVFTVLAHITEYFPDITPEFLEEAPKIQLTETTRDFGKLVEGTSPSAEFEFSNAGKKDLIIRKLKASCVAENIKDLELKSRYVQDPKCLPGNASKTTIRPGETAKIKVSLPTSGKKGLLSKTVFIYCNDPANPNPNIYLKALVQEN